MMKKREVPAFQSESEEAHWWYAHRGELDQGFEEAAQSGALKKIGPHGIFKRLSGTRVVSIRLPEADLAKLRHLATEKGLPYQTYLKSLLHEGIKREEKRRAS
jgi:predicted DNA binding CopG/RHH family protein